MPRTVLMCLVLAMGIAPMAGCGSSSPKPEGTIITKAQAVRFAHMVNLRAADLPGWKLDRPGHEEDTVEQATVRYSQCDGGVSPRRQVAFVWSPTFAISVGRITYRLTSAVRVLPTAALVVKDEHARTSSLGFICGRSGLARETAGRTLFRLPAFGNVPRSYAFRAVNLASRRQPDPLRDYVETIGFPSGVAEVALFAESASRPAPRATERRLLSLLYSRVSAHRLA